MLYFDTIALEERLKKLTDGECISLIIQLVKLIDDNLMKIYNKVPKRVSGVQVKVRYESWIISPKEKLQALFGVLGIKI